MEKVQITTTMDGRTATTKGDWAGRAQQYSTALPPRIIFPSSHLIANLDEHLVV